MANNKPKRATAKPRKGELVQIGFWMPVDLATAAKNQAASQDMSLTKWFRSLVRASVTLPTSAANGNA